MAARYNDSGREWLTREEITLLVKNELHPFHEQNLAKFSQLFEALNQLKGSIQAGIWFVGAIVAVVGLIIAFNHK